MEEPEIAVPPHTQRRIAQYLLTKTTQAFVTSHSPFVIEKFEPSKTLLLSRDGGMVSARKVSDATGLKDNDYKRFSRSGLSECMLGRAAIVVEGVTELHAMPIIARRMEENDPNLQPLDIAGVAFFDADGESNMPSSVSSSKRWGCAPSLSTTSTTRRSAKPSRRRHLRKISRLTSSTPTRALKTSWWLKCQWIDFGHSSKASKQTANMAISPSPTRAHPTTRSRPSPRRLSAETKAQAGRPAFLKSANSTSCRLPPHSSSRPCSLCSHRRRPSTRAAATTPICSPDHERALPAS